MDEQLGFSISQLVSRFEFYATNLKLIKHNPSPERRSETHFMHLDIESLQVALSNGLSVPALLLQTPEVDKSTGYDNISEQYDFTYVVLLKDEPSKANLYTKAKNISDKTYNRMLKDVAEGIIPGTIVGTTEGYFGPVGDGLYGWAKSCTIIDGYNGEVDPKDWEDLEWL